MPFLDYRRFEPRINPAHERLENEVLGWATGFGLIDQAHAALFRNNRAIDIHRRMYPDLGYDGMRLGADLFFWAEVTDDLMFDGWFGYKPRWQAAAHTWLSEIFDDPHASEHRRLGERIRAAVPERAQDVARAIEETCIDLSKRIWQMATPQEHAQLMLEIRDFTAGTIWESTLRAAGCNPTVDEYHLGRRNTVGVGMAAMYGSLGGDYIVQSDEIYQPRMHRLMNLAGDIWWSCNDIMSYYKELDTDRNELFNLPLLLQAERGMSEQGSLDETARLHNERMAEFVELKAALLDDSSPSLRKFIDNVGAILRAHYDFSRYVGRYSTRDFFNDPHGFFEDGPMEEVAREYRIQPKASQIRV
ncbi:MAG: hypothetical protein NXH91_06100 [Phyllobacteriaceae bacterium]|jgi:hypothetical protein|nr:hypothetical protein [Phyllobacteriaceae bacterium]